MTETFTDTETLDASTDPSFNDLVEAELYVSEINRLVNNPPINLQDKKIDPIWKEQKMVVRQKFNLPKRTVLMEKIKRKRETDGEDEIIHLKVLTVRDSTGERIEDGIPENEKIASSKFIHKKYFWPNFYDLFMLELGTACENLTNSDYLYVLIEWSSPGVDNIYLAEKLKRRDSDWRIKQQREREAMSEEEWKNHVEAFNELNDGPENDTNWSIIGEGFSSFHIEDEKRNCLHIERRV